MHTPLHTRNIFTSRVCVCVCYYSAYLSPKLSCKTRLQYRQVDATETAERKGKWGCRLEWWNSKERWKTGEIRECVVRGEGGATCGDYLTWIEVHFFFIFYFLLPFFFSYSLDAFHPAFVLLPFRAPSSLSPGFSSVFFFFSNFNSNGVSLVEFNLYIFFLRFLSSWIDVINDMRFQSWTLSFHSKTRTPVLFSCFHFWTVFFLIVKPALLK